METILVVGTESLMGANWQAILREDCLPGQQIVGVPAEEVRSTESVKTVLRTHSPLRVIVCGSGARSPWFDAAPLRADESEFARIWATEMQLVNRSLTYFSTDAVFSGPWMYHTESSECLSPSPEAQHLREAEAHVLRECPNALIVRTNAYGWQTCEGWIEKTIATLSTITTPVVDASHHATPIFVGDLVEIVQRAWCVGLNGIYHIAGGERVNPAQFIAKLAAQFQYDAPRFPLAETLIQREVGFGRGETSLNCRKIRRATGLAMPLLNDGLAKLREQGEQGFRSELSPQREERFAA